MLLLTYELKIVNNTMTYIHYIHLFVHMTTPKNEKPFLKKVTKLKKNIYLTVQKRIVNNSRPSHNIRAGLTRQRK